MRLDAPGGPLRGRPFLTRAWKPAAVLGGLALAHAAALAVAATPAGQAWLRARAERALRERLGEVAIGGRISVDPLLRVSLGPVEREASGAFPAVRIERVRVRPSLLALLGGRLEPAAIRLLGLRAEGLSLAGLPLDPGPADVDLDLSRSGEERRLRAEASLARGGLLSLDARRDGEGWHLRARASGVALGRPGSPVREGTLSFEGEAEAALDLSRADGRVRATLDGVVLEGQRLAERPLGPIRAEAEGTLEWLGASRRLSLRDATASLPGDLSLSASGDAWLAPGVPFALSVRADGVNLAALAAALPEGLAPPAGAPRPAGTFDARLDLSGPLRAPAAWALAATLDLSRMRALARRSPPAPLAAPFPHHPFGADDGVPSFVVGPGNPDFVPVDELPEHVVRAVTTAEDAGFFAHAGFDFEELRNAIAQGAEAGRLVRGGSTISQQLAKNLWLGPERTLARKVREALATVALEASVPKRRILEIYLNVAEWGPGVWGIGPAARAWLGKDARDLTPKEAAFLASVIPSPVRFHGLLAHGGGAEALEERVRTILLGMTQNGTLTEDELLHALEQPLRPAGG